MRNLHPVYRMVERALAMAHAALEETTTPRAALARRSAAEAWRSVRRVQPRALTLGEGRELLEGIFHLRAALELLERRTGPTGLPEPN